jgi:predicted RNA-binding protein (virulence factor B family)
VILLPGSEIPDDARQGDELSVLIYLDSEDRPVATRRPPRLTLDEVAFLEVTDVTPIGAFVDWGPPKELLVPHAEQTRELRVGDRHPIGLFVDSSGRLAGTMRVSEMLKKTGDFKLDEWVVGEAWRSEPEMGVFFILERRFVGLLPAGEPHTLSRGQEARVRIASVLPDGKVELSLRGHAHEELESDAQKILEVLGRPGAPSVGDQTSPEQIRAIFGLSKKAFKRAAGRLLKQGAVTVDREGHFIRRGTDTRRGR